MLIPTIKRVALSGGLAPYRLRGLQAVLDPDRMQEIVTVIGGKARALDKNGLVKAGNEDGNTVKAVYGTLSILAK